ncbi:hypothetical protein V6N11_045109, partial [Hibiscus sabdariffa]
GCREEDNFETIVTRGTTLAGPSLLQGENKFVEQLDTTAEEKVHGEAASSFFHWRSML